ncbi:hypothetical protein MUO14_17990 [Halobacillus shinanisalinarum]|uniref:Sodium Bile acid symporter family protein n=1 Tax=Halobacillus shinanisalinarum TaxID=2932258 RepID=A0ABY4GWA8_9BACI|nr:AEC family transporter [Halobacillus shinanisalinarum]UOQ92344.1 hypothetical protein MUO14_17990 [Halobacillus shinanisalinarum]
METAIVLMVLHQLLMSTLGVYYAAKGGESSNGFKTAISSVRKMPMVYGAILGLVFHLSGISLGGVKEGVDLIADAAIPLIMITLGMQLANIKVASVNYKKLSTALLLSCWQHL